MTHASGPRTARSCASLGGRVLGAACLLAAGAALAQAPVEPVYKQHCASCHGEQRLGGMGPALLPENLSRLKKPEAAKPFFERFLEDAPPGHAARAEAERQLSSSKTSAGATPTPSAPAKPAAAPPAKPGKPGGKP